MKNYFSSTFILFSLPLLVALMGLSLLAKLITFETSDVNLINHLIYNIFLWSPLYLSACFVYNRGKDIELANLLCYIIFAVSTGYPSYKNLLSLGIVGGICVSYIVIYVYENINISIRGKSLQFLPESAIKLFISMALVLLASIVFTTILPIILELLMDFLYFLSSEYNESFLFLNDFLMVASLPLGLQEIFYTIDWSTSTGVPIEDISLNYLYTLILQNQEQNLVFFTSNIFSLVAVFIVIYFLLFDRKERKHFSLFFLFTLLFTIISGSSIVLLLVLFLYSPAMFFSFSALNAVALSLFHFFGINALALKNGGLLFLLNDFDVKANALLYLEIQSGIFLSFLVIFLVAVKLFSLARNKNLDKNNQILLDALGGISNITRVIQDGNKVKFMLLNKSLTSLENIENLSNVISVSDPGNNHIQILFEEAPKNILSKIDENLQLKTLTQVITTQPESNSQTQKISSI